MPDPANSNVEPAVFDMRQDEEGWTVYNVRTNEPARVKGVPLTGLDIADADDLVDLLNRLSQRTGVSFSLQGLEMTDDADPVLEAVEALRADGVQIEPMGDDFHFWIVGQLPMTDADVIRLAASRGLVEDGESG